jgi:four helix bundle protein
MLEFRAISVPKAKAKAKEEEEGRRRLGVCNWRVHPEGMKEKTDLRDRTKNFALRVVKMFCSLPKTTEAHVLGNQILRSGTSIGANYREAYRGRSKAEFISKCGESLRELEETAYWMELLGDSGIIAGARLTDLRAECDELSAIFVTVLKLAKSSS